jgi:hypothetical protein
MVPIGSRFSYVLSGQYGGVWALFPTASAFEKGVQDGFRKTNVALQTFRIETGETLGGWARTTFPYEARATVETRREYGSPDDVRSIVKGVFWEAADHEPLFQSSAIPQITPPNWNLSLGLIAVIAAIGAVVWFKR